MPINLQKGQKVDLTKTNPGLMKVLVGLGWDVNRYDGNEGFDLDASLFLLDGNGKAAQDTDFIFYNNPKSSDGSVQHLGDNTTGEGDGDDEQITINLTEVPDRIQKIAFTVTIHDAETRSQNFGMVSNAFIRVANETTGVELIRYDLSEDYSIETALVVGELYRHNGEWKFNAIGGGFAGGLGALVSNFGLST